MYLKRSTSYAANHSDVSEKDEDTPFYWGMRIYNAMQTMNCDKDLAIDSNAVIGSDAAIDSEATNDSEATIDSDAAIGGANDLAEVFEANQLIGNTHEQNQEIAIVDSGGALASEQL